MTASRELVLVQAAQRRGVPYRIDPPPDGINNIDCSLYVLYTFRDAGVPFPDGIRTAEQIRQVCDPIDWSAVQPGDLLFFGKTYNAGGPAGPDGKIASHIGISTGGGTKRMWDAHESTTGARLSGVDQTDIGTDYWQDHLLEARRPRQLADEVGVAPQVQPTIGTARFRTVDSGVRLRQSPSTTLTPLIEDLGRDTELSSVDDLVIDAEGHHWRHVKTADGNIGYVADELLTHVEPPKYHLLDAGVRLRPTPSTAQPPVVEDLGRNSVVTALDDTVVEADGHRWRHVATADGKVGFVAAELLGAGSEPAPAHTDGPSVDAGPELSMEPDHAFGFEGLRPAIDAAADKYGIDARVLAAIVAQESGFINYRVHLDGTGHGLLGLDDNGLLPFFEKWSGLSCGRGASAEIIPPRLQLNYCAMVLADYSNRHGGIYNAARAWHRGEPSYQDSVGADYEALIRRHISELFAVA